MSDDVRERVAQALYANYRMVYAEMSGAVPPSPAEIAELWEAEIHYKDQFYRQANVLAEAGLLAPAPLREDGVGWYEVIHPSRATTHIAYVHEDGSIYFPEGTQVLDSHEFTFAAARGLAHRLVRADAVDRAEGDGRAVSHE